MPKGHMACEVNEIKSLYPTSERVDHIKCELISHFTSSTSTLKQLLKQTDFWAMYFS